MKFIKKILGFNSPYSWTKWLRMGALGIAMLAVFSYFSTFLPLILDGDILGLFIWLIVFVIVLGPTFAVLLGVTLVIGAIIGAVQSGKKQSQSLKESAASGSAELLDLDKLRMKVQAMTLILGLLIAVMVITCIVISFADSLSDSLTIGGEAVNLLDFDLEDATPLFVFGFIVIIVLGLVRNKLNKQYKDSFKEQIVKTELESFLSDMEFAPEKKLDESIIKDSRLFSYDVYFGNDYLSATYKDRRFVQSDIHLQEKHEEEYKDEDGDWHTRTTYTTVFRGRLMIFDYESVSKEPVYVYDKRMLRHAGDGIQTELDSFNRKFTVRASDAVSAFRILTPPVLEGISLASDKLNCPISLSFLNGKIYIAVSNGDTFEATVKGDATLSEQRKRVRKEIQAVLDMVETIYLKNIG